MAAIDSADGIQLAGVCSGHTCDYARLVGGGVYPGNHPDGPFLDSSQPIQRYIGMANQPIGDDVEATIIEEGIWSSIFSLPRSAHSVLELLLSNPVIFRKNSTVPHE